MPRPQNQNQATNIFNLELAGQLGEDTDNNIGPKNS